MTPHPPKKPPSTHRYSIRGTQIPIWLQKPHWKICDRLFISKLYLCSHDKFPGWNSTSLDNTLWGFFLK